MAPGARLDPQTRAAATELWLVRHGESTGNRDGVLQGQEDMPLSDTGRAQVAALATRLAQTSFDAIYASDLERARRSAEAVAAGRGLHVVCDAGLREIDAGAWSGLSMEQVRERFPEEWTAWELHRDPDLRRGGGESYRMAQERICAAIDAIARRHPGGRILVVFHGGVLRAYLSRLLGLDLGRIWQFSIANTAITRVRPQSPDRPGDRAVHGRLLSLNDSAHLERMMEPR